MIAVILSFAAEAGAGPDRSDIVAHLGEAIRFRTVVSGTQESFSAFQGWLEQTYPLIHAKTTREVFPKALLYRWAGSDPTLLPVLVMAHQDVVPVDPNTQGRWTHPPFSGEVADGFVWGRGALDDKGMLIALLETFETLLAEGRRPARTVYLLAGEDEESGGLQGAARVAAELERRQVRFAWVLDEGGSIVQGYLPRVIEPVAMIGCAEKGYATVELIAHGESGHSSMPPRHTAIGALAHALAKLEDNPLPARLSPMMRRSVRRFHNEQASQDADILHDLELHPGTNASVRTTITPTILEAGLKDNVLPAQARAVLNIRLLPGDTAGGAIAYLRDLIADPAIEIRVPPHTTFNPVPVSSTDGPGFTALSETIGAMYPGVTVLPTLTNGTTDSRHLFRIADGIYHFAPWTLDPSDLRRIHGIDERLSVSQLTTAVTFFSALLKRGAGVQ